MHVSNRSLSNLCCWRLPRLWLAAAEKREGESRGAMFDAMIERGKHLTSLMFKPY